LEIKIKENYYQKLGNSANNFIATLPIEQSKLATQTVKEMIN
jgi:hypothetical protein